jgi:GTP-binding protein
MKNIVAIVGRPNVGKSTFFNRCIGLRHAIVDDSAGVTRDRIYHEADWSGRDFVLIDTGGIVLDKKEALSSQVLQQAKLAIDEADVIVFMVDGKSGLVGADKEIANILRQSKKPILLTVNKIDEFKEVDNISEFYELGLGEPLPVSAMRGSGFVGDLLDRVVGLFPEKEKKSKSKSRQKSKADKPEDDQTDEESSISSDSSNQDDEGEDTELDENRELAIAIVGKPNVGKSSMINLLCGAERTIVSAEPGTTRDAIDTGIIHQGRQIKLIDTAGIRRKSRVDYGIEAFSVVRSLKAIDRADIVILMLDAKEEISDQEKKIANKIEDAGKAAVLVLNKWDLIESKSSKLMNEFTEKVKVELRSLAFAEVIFTSVKTRLRATKVLEAAERAYAATTKRIGTGLLNQVIHEATVLVPPPSAKRGKRLRIYYCTQASVAPPTFVLFVNDHKLITQSYQAYLEKTLRNSFGFVGAPIRMIIRSKRDG